MQGLLLVLLTLVLMMVLVPCWISAGDPILFPEDDNDNHSTSGQQVNEIPESLLIKLKDVQNISEFFRVFLPEEQIPAFGQPGAAPEAGGIFGRGGPSEVPEVTKIGLSGYGSPVGLAKNAACEPHLQIVEFRKPTDATVLLWPSCTRVARCGGCCYSQQLACVAVKTSTTQIKVIKARYPRVGAKSLEMNGFEVITLEKHEKCECQCKEKESDCNFRHYYKPEECRCVCKDTASAEKCEGPDKVWDVRDCVCKCKTYDECSTGLFYNPQSCRCEIVRSSLIGRAGRRPVPRVASPIHARASEPMTFRVPYSGIPPPQEDIVPYRMVRSQVVEEVSEVSTESPQSAGDLH